MNKPISHEAVLLDHFAFKQTFPPPAPTDASLWLLLFGIIYPAGVIAFELVTRLCAQTFFDPVPTLWHGAVVALVPISNLAAWLYLRKGGRPNARWLSLLGGLCVAVACFYALVFLPLTPLALLGILLYGLGVLPFAPLAAFISALVLRARLRAKRPAFGGFFWAGILAGAAALIALDLSAAATRLGLQWAVSASPEQRDKGIALLRAFGDEDLLLRLCYDAAGRSGGLLSFLVVGSGALFPQQQQRLTASTTQARQIFYRVTGTPFNARPAPYGGGRWAAIGDFEFDRDIGGTEIGGRVKGLSLVSSRIDGSVSGDSALAYLEWIFEFRNTSALQREVRLQLAVPPGAVVARASLWIDGVEREAAYGGRNQVRRAYEQVVRVRRDPLLVTTKGADRVLAQAFPVPPNGGTIKFKLGITAPLDVGDPAHGRLRLPAIVDRNFSFDGALKHSLWIEAERPLGMPNLSGMAVTPRLFRLAGELADRELAQATPVITADRDPTLLRTWTAGDGSRPIVQEIVAGERTPAGALVIVIDGSAKLERHRPQLLAALERIPPGARVGLMIADEPGTRVPVAPWSDAQKLGVTRAIRSARFVGGQDNSAALSEALQALEPSEQAHVLWIHAPQPVAFIGSRDRLEQAAARLARLPQLTLYAVEPGPNELLPDAPWAWSARTLPRSAAAGADLASYFDETLGGGRINDIKRAEAEATDGAVKGSPHIARLWANDRVSSLMREDPVRNRAAAEQLAASRSIVTPVSGAVVLESRQQYDANGLQPPDGAAAAGPSSIPTVPEPHEWLLLIMACGTLLWVVRRRRASPALR